MIRNRLITLQIIVLIVISAVVFSLLYLLIFLPGNNSLTEYECAAPTVSPDITVYNGESSEPFDKIELIKGNDEVSDAPSNEDELIKILTNEIDSSNAILLHLDTGDVIAQKAPDERIFPASTTKILTTMIAIEYYDDLDILLEVPSDIFPYLTQQNASCAGFKAGEKVSVIDLLHGIMLPSGADACLTIAKYVAGNEQAFAKKMTDKAHEIGAVNTNFTNSTGLHDDNHYTTARDMSIILTYALKNETFRKIFTTETYTTSATDKHPYGITLTSTTFSALSRAGITDHYVLGGKTGFTGEARLCLASLGLVNNKEYILVTCGAGTPNSYRGTKHAIDADYIYDNLQSWLEYTAIPAA